MDITSKHSSTMLVGRSMPLVASIWHGAPGGAVQTVAPVEWTSSNPDIVAVAGDVASAANPGTTLITASCLGIHASTGATQLIVDTASITVVSQGYSITPVVEATGGLIPTAFNDSGYVAGETTPLTSGSFLWRGGVSTSLGDCVARSVTNSGRVLCRSYPGPNPRIWEDGVAAALDTLTRVIARAANDSGVVLLQLSTGEVVRWHPDRTLDTLQAIPFYRAYQGSDINKAGDVVGVMWAAPYYQVALWRGATIVQLGPSMRSLGGGAVNEAGDVVANHDGGALVALVDAEWTAVPLRAGGGGYNDIVTAALDINDSRQIVGTGTQGPFVWEDGRVTLLNEALVDDSWTVETAVKINNLGRILGTATRDGVRFIILLEPGVTPAPSSRAARTP